MIKRKGQAARKRQSLVQTGKASMYMPVYPVKVALRKAGLA
jgi:hypothetical protein